MKIIRYQKPEMTTWSPFDRLGSLREEMNHLFESVLPTWGRDEELFAGWAPVVDVFQDNDNLTVTVEVPGMKKEDIDVSVHDGMLSISGERKREEQHKDAEQFRSERFFGKFHRSLALPVGVDAKKVTAAYRNGVLTITLPKAEEAKPKKIEVSVN